MSDKLPRIRPTMQDWRDAQDFRLLVKHPDLIQHLDCGVYDVYSSPASMTPYHANIDGLHAALEILRKMLEEQDG